MRRQLRYRPIADDFFVPFSPGTLPISITFLRPSQDPRIPKAISSQFGRKILTTLIPTQYDDNAASTTETELRHRLALVFPTLRPEQHGALLFAAGRPEPALSLMITIRTYEFS